MGKQGKATLWKEDSRTTELGQDTGGNREPWGGRAGFHSHHALGAVMWGALSQVVGIHRWANAS